MLTHLPPGPPGKLDIADSNMLVQRLVDAAAIGAPLETAVLEIVRDFGFDSFMYGMLTDATPQKDSRSYVWTTLPKEWVAMYDRNAYIEIDPRLTETCNRTTPYLWDRATVSADQRVQDFLDAAAAFGVCSGVVVSFRDLSHARIIVALNSAISPVDEDRRAMIVANLGSIMLLATCFHDVFMARFVDRGVPPLQKGVPLTPRELQCLQLAAHGMTSIDIGIKLKITERTANYHFGNILSKLDALNRAEAIAKGMQLGLIKRNF